MNYLKLVSITVALIMSSSVSASVLNTLNGINYEWLELTETFGLSRDQIEIRLADPNDVLYGYEYASRSLVEDLYMSYSGWDGLGGLHSAADVVSGATSFFNDFGYYKQEPIIFSSYSADEGLLFNSSFVTLVHGIYGLEDECRGVDESCFTQWVMYSDENLTTQTTWQSSSHGWDSTTNSLLPILDWTSSGQRGSFLVQVETVPVPAAAWLFTSGLIGLVGLARRKKA